MAECFISPIIDIAKKGIDGLIYLVRIGKIIIDVESEKKKLISNRELVQEKLEATDHKIEKVDDAVFEWLKEMEEKLTQEENLKTIIGSEREIANLGCLLHFGPPRHRRISERRYRMYNEMLKKIKALNANCVFESFSSPIPGLELFSSGNFVCFEPMKEASDRLIEALQDDNFYVIGLYRKRGSGKTKLVKAVGEKAKYLRNFGAVLFVTVSQNPNVRRIQHKIADSLNLKFDRNTQPGRARKIYSKLESMDRLIMVILDDVRGNLDLDEIGIPCNSNRCKILLTTRCQRECALMDCQKEIPLGPLPKEEAWTLLKKHSGIDDNDNESSGSFDLLNVACEVANECEGLLGTIKDVGSSLKGKSIEEWKASLDSLRHSTVCYHIFLSFRGEDTRRSFTGFLYDALCWEGFKTFIDDGGLCYEPNSSRVTLQNLEKETKEIKNRN